MRRPLAAVLLAAAAFGAAHAEGDPRREARLLYLEGKFRDADALLEKAGPEVAGDLELRAQLADAAEKSLKNKTGEERREGLEAARKSWGKVAEAKPDDAAAVAGAVRAAAEIAKLDVAKRQTDAAKAQTTWAIQIAEKAAAAPLSPEAHAAVGEAYGVRASLSKKAEFADQIVADYRKAAELYEKAAEGHERAAQWLSEAARLRVAEATFVHDAIPIPKETRDDEAIAAAIVLAKRACEAKSAPEETFVLHIQALCTAKSWKTPGDHGQPFVQPLAPPFEGLSLMIPRNAKWKRLEKTSEWDLILERPRYTEEEGGGVQIMLTGHEPNESCGAKPWSQVEEAAATQFEMRKNQYGDVAGVTEPTGFGGDKKKGPRLWHFQIAGTVKDSTRRNKMAEWIWQGREKGDDRVFELRIIDWRFEVDVEAPDLMAFVRSATPPGTGAPGSGPAEDPKGKGKRPPKK